MRLGVVMFPTDETILPGHLAVEVEDRGFESLFFPEHSHMPVQRTSIHPAGTVDVPRAYHRILDPFVALTAAAAATERIKIGTGVCLAYQRDPIIMAKEVATLDLLSGGRFLFGVGGGWNREEMRNHGIDPSTRWRVLEEKILAMKTIWTQDRPEFHGEFVDFDPIWCWPKPVNKPHPPVLIGGSGPSAFERLFRYGDEWFPAPYMTEGLFSRIANLGRLAADRGIQPIPVSIFGAAPDDQALAELSEAGVGRAVLNLPSGPPEVVLPVLDTYSSFIGRH